MRDLSMHKLIIFILVLPIFSGLLGCERAKTRFDRKVDRLCAADAGDRIYEKVALPKAYFGDDGQFTSDFSRSLLDIHGNEKNPFHSVVTRSDVESMGQLFPIRTSIKIQRTSEYLIRTLDGKILGERVVYSRVGGDFFGPWEASSAHSCPIFKSGLSNEIFVRGD
ncbi:MAG: hypothetical protein AB7E35_12225 [Diaphorobacter sp.]